jgi:magnesium-dependent phosphatase 1
MAAAVSTSSSIPKLIVFDLDECLWSPEMYQLDEIPNADKSCIRGMLGRSGKEGVVGVKSGRATVQLHPGAMLALQEFYNGKYPGMRIAAASSADTPHAVKIGRASLGLLEVVPGVTVRQVFNQGWDEGFEGNMQIGRTPPLSSRKEVTHFPILKEHTGIAYEDMLFFDDCNWGDHVGNVKRTCGVVGHRTPHGLQEDDWIAGLKLYAESKLR